MTLANMGSAFRDRRVARHVLVRCAVGFASMGVVSCGPAANETPQPIVDYKNVPTNPAFAANGSISSGNQLAQPSSEPAPSGEPSPASGAMPPTAASPGGDPAAPVSAASSGVTPSAGTPETPTNGGVAGAMSGMPSVAGAAGAAIGPATGMPVSTEPAQTRPTLLTLEFTTKTQRGRYAPKNVGAAWVETPNGKWIHTLEYWAGMPNDSHLTRYNAAGGPNYATSGELARVLGLPPYTTKPPADVVAGPTLDLHKLHSGSMWNLKNAQGMEVPDGDYRVVIELTEVDATGKSQEIPFKKGPMPVEITMDYEFYSSVKLTLQ